MVFACQSRYGYLSKVRVGSTHKQKLENDKIDKSNSDKEPEIEGDEELVTASNDTNVIVPNQLFFRGIKGIDKTNATKQKNKANISKKQINKGKIADDKNINYFAKWAYTMGLITFLGSLILVPIIFGPLDIVLGIIALRQIAKSGERGIGRAIIGIIIGIFFTSFILIGFFQFAIETPVFTTLLIELLLAFGILIITFFVLKKIKKGNKNPKNEADLNRNDPFEMQIIKLGKISYFIGILTFFLSFALIGFALGPMTLILAQRALKITPMKYKNRRIFLKIIVVVGILATIGLLLCLAILILGSLAELGTWGILFILIILLGLLLMGIAFSIRKKFPITDSY